MDKFIKNILESVRFAERYIELCNRYPEMDNGGLFNKQAMSNILTECGSDLKYSSREKLFYKDYTIGEINLRFVLPYKYGFIDCLYALWNKDNTERVRGGFGALAALVDGEFSNKVKHKFPVATSECELKEIIGCLLQLHADFIRKLEEKLISN